MINSVAPILDHTPIVLQTVIPMQRPYRRTFRFENMWLQEPKLDGVIERSWDAGDGSELTHRLSNCARDLAMWAKKISGRFRVEIDLYKACLMMTALQHSRQPKSGCAFFYLRKNFTGDSGQNPFG